MARELVELAETKADAKKMAADVSRRSGCKAYVRSYEMKGITGYRTVYGVYLPQTCFRQPKRSR